MLNELVAISRDTPDSLSIHLDRSDKSLRERYVLILEGLDKLGVLLRSDDRMQGIRTIALTSPLVKTFSARLKKEGFTIDENGRDPLGRILKRKYAAVDAKTYKAKALGLMGINTQDVFASMTKEEFLRRRPGPALSP